MNGVKRINYLEKGQTTQARNHYTYSISNVKKSLI